MKSKRYDAAVGYAERAIAIIISDLSGWKAEGGVVSQLDELFTIVIEAYIAQSMWKPVVDAAQGFWAVVEDAVRNLHNPLLNHRSRRKERSS